MGFSAFQQKNLAIIKAAQRKMGDRELEDLFGLSAKNLALIKAAQRKMGDRELEDLLGLSAKNAALVKAAKSFAKKVAKRPKKKRSGWGSLFSRSRRRFGRRRSRRSRRRRS